MSGGGGGGGDSAPKYNQRSPAVRRILKEAKELQDDPSDEFVARFLDEDIFEWHFTIRGPPDTDYEGGLYHGRIILPPEYPMKPPSIILLTPNGRFEVGKKICLSITGYHPEYWQPAWGIRSVCTALQSFFPAPGDGAVGALDHTPEERRKHAKKSSSYVCKECAEDDRMNTARIFSAIARKAPIKETLADGLAISFAYEKPKTSGNEGASSSSSAAAAAASASSSAAPSPVPSPAPSPAKLPISAPATPSSSVDGASSAAASAPSSPVPPSSAMMRARTSTPPSPSPSISSRRADSQQQHLQQPAQVAPASGPSTATLDKLIGFVVLFLGFYFYFLTSSSC